MDEDQKPTMTEQELWEWLHYDEGIPVTRRAIKMAVINREILPTRLVMRISSPSATAWFGCNHASKQDAIPRRKLLLQPHKRRSPPAHFGGRTGGELFACGLEGQQG